MTTTPSTLEEGPDIPATRGRARKYTQVLAVIYQAAVGRHPSLQTAMKTMDELSDAVCTSESYVNDAAFKALRRTYGASH